MTRFAAILVVLAAACVAAAVARAQAELDTTPALQAARTWLVEMDAGRYAVAWEQASPILREATPRTEWEIGLVRARGPQGVVVARKIRSASCTRGTRIDPEGEACLLQYGTHFENRPLGDEQLTMVKGRDGVWRVAAYSLK